MKLREGLAIGSLVAGASLGAANEGCVYSAYPQGKPGGVQPNKERVAEKVELENKLGAFQEVGDVDNPMSDLEDPFVAACQKMRQSIDFVIDGKHVTLVDCDVDETGR